MISTSRKRSYTSQTNGEKEVRDTSPVSKWYFNDRFNTIVKYKLIPKSEKKYLLEKNWENEKKDFKITYKEGKFEDEKIEKWYDKTKMKYIQAHYFKWKKRWVTLEEKKKLEEEKKKKNQRKRKKRAEEYKRECEEKSEQERKKKIERLKRIETLCYKKFHLSLNTSPKLKETIRKNLKAEIRCFLGSIPIPNSLTKRYPIYRDLLNDDPPTFEIFLKENGEFEYVTLECFPYPDGQYLILIVNRDKNEDKDGKSKNHDHDSHICIYNHFNSEFKIEDNVGIGGEVYKNSDYFEGTFKNVRKEGKGVYYWKNGDFYEGVYKRDRME